MGVCLESESTLDRREKAREAAAVASASAIPDVPRRSDVVSGLSRRGGGGKALDLRRCRKKL